MPVTSGAPRQVGRLTLIESLSKATPGPARLDAWVLAGEQFRGPCDRGAGCVSRSGHVPRCAKPGREPDGNL